MLRIVVACCVFLWGLPAFGQVLDTTIQLPEVEVGAMWVSPSTIGSYSQHLDTLSVPIILLEDVGNALALSGQVFIKDYGPGQLVSLSQQGGGANQTAILWNGIPIQNPFLGQNDLRLLPVFGQTVLSGPGSASDLASGDLAGVLQIGNDLGIDERLQWTLSGGFGQFGRYSAATTLTAGKEAWSNRTQLLYQDHRNNFTFEDLRGREQTQDHARFRQGQVLQENRWSPSDKHVLDLRVWYLNAHREIPPVLGQQSSEAVQDDQSLRIQLGWKGMFQKWTVRAKTAYLDDHLDYTDAGASIFSKSRSGTSWNELSGQYPLGKRSLISMGGRLSLVQGSSSNIELAQRETRPALSFSWRYQSLEELFKLRLRLRQEWRNGEAAPFSPYLGMEWKLLPAIRWTGSATYAYRLPTFNDLYWEPGGNPDLLPEQGWAIQSGLGGALSIEQVQLEGGVDFFSRWVSDWIQWLPDQGLIWRPENVKQVWSRGIETQASILWEAWDQGFIYVKGSYRWTRSTEEEVASGLSRQEGAQIIYVPIHQGGIQGKVSWKKVGFTYIHQVVGQVFTLADNSEILPAYSTGQLTASYDWSTSKLGAKLLLSLNNLWGESYQVVAGRPMPGRSFLMRFQFTFSK